ncbi:hypothetical protein Trydic_g12646 [Trypoxylus dichotomus]
MYVYEFSNTIDADIAGVWFNQEDTTTIEPERYIIYNSKCRLPDLDPFNRDVIQFHEKKTYVPCTTKDLLTYVENNGSTAIIYINKTVEPHYAITGTTCRLSYVSRIDDMHINLTEYVEFESGTSLKGNTIIVKCYSKWTEEEVYANAHTVAILNENIRKTAIPDESKPNVLLIGIDSVSRLNIYRTMPKTVKYLQDIEFIEYKGYNKVEDNTFPNLMAILTGNNMSKIIEDCNPYNGSLSKCTFLWDDFKKAGYITAYAEDETNINTFNYMKAGFSEQPTDFCYLSYMLASESLWTSMLDHRSYCSGPETSTERTLNAAKDFVTALSGYPKFGLFWTSTGSHDYLNSPTRFDEVYFKFFRDVYENGILNNTIVIFLSDHGLRFGNILLTTNGWLEERLPFLYLSFPPKFRKSYPKKYEKIKTNLMRLTSPYDLHLTLKDVLQIYSNTANRNVCAGCPTCKSLFQEADEIRSCEDAGIPVHYCTCTGYKYHDPNSSLSKSAVNFILNSLNKKTLTNDIAASRCTLLKTNKIISASISESDAHWYKNNTYLIVVFTTIPETILRATVKVINDPNERTAFELQGDISRLDFYKFTSQCISAWTYKIYCYCKVNQLLDMNFFSFWFEV